MGAYDSDMFQIAAQILNTTPDMLDHKLVNYLEELEELVIITGGRVASRQIVALAVLTWRHGITEDFPQTGFSR